MKLYPAFVIVLLLTSCQIMNESNDKDMLDVIPRPVSFTRGTEIFELKKESAIYVQGGSGELVRIGQYLADKLNPSTGYDLKVSPITEKPGPGNIVLELVGNTDLGKEGYELNVTNNGVKLTAADPAGLFRGIQTIRQLFPAAIEMKTPQSGPWQIPAVAVRDYPEYEFRGSMLDVSRHFFGLQDVKRYIDLIAYYKMNVMHLHLSDDQGWRIEIKSWPDLTTIGSASEVGEGKGGYYTQEQYREIVQYAADRYITIIPEIDMPGHTNAALASYAELNCNDSTTNLYRGIEVGFSTLCINKDVTYKFVDDVVRELAAMTPGPYIHLGGDESHATKHDDYIVFIDTVQQIVEKHGKKMIGWEEIAQSTLRPNTIVQYWSNEKHAQAGARKGAKIIMSPATKVYLDMKYDKETKIGQDWAALIEVDQSYDWNPQTLVEGIAKESILGIEAPLWTETVTTMDEIEYLVFPRLIGIAELAWTPDTMLDWDEYEGRLARHAPRLSALDIDYYKSDEVDWEQ